MPCIIKRIVANPLAFAGAFKWSFLYWKCQICQVLMSMVWRRGGGWHWLGDLIRDEAVAELVVPIETLAGADDR